MKLVELGTILHMDKGKKPQKQQEKYKEGYLPYVDIQAFEEGIIKSYADPQKCLLCEDGDLLIVCDGSRSGLTGRAIKGVVGSTLSKISADGLCTEYLQYFIQSIKTESLYNEKIEDAALWVTLQYIRVINDIREKIKEKQKAFNTATIQIIVALLAYVISMLIHNGGLK